MAPKSNRKSITKEEYYKLKAYQSIHNQIIILLENLELDALEITQEIDPKDSFDRYLLGGLTSDLLNNSNPKAVDDVLKLLGLVVENDKVEKKSMKDVGKVSRKKYKSGSWKGKKGVGDFNVEFDESDEMKKYLEDHTIKISPPDENIIIKGREESASLIDKDKIWLMGNILSFTGNLDGEVGSFTGNIDSGIDSKIGGFVIDKNNLNDESGAVV